MLSFSKYPTTTGQWINIKKVLGFGRYNEKATFWNYKVYIRLPVRWGWAGTSWAFSVQLGLARVCFTWLFENKLSLKKDLLS